LWQWHNEIVRGELQRHISLVAPLRVGIIATNVARSMYTETLNLLAGSISVLDVNDPNIGEVGVVAVLAENNASAWATYTQVMSRLGNAVPVVYCLPDRRLAKTAPGWENSGIHYEGMFKLASLYAPTVSRRAGSYVEFGVYDGKSFILACHALRDVCSSFFAFDSFAGIRGTHGDEQTHFKDEQYSASLETLKYNLQFANVDASTVRVVPGFFQDSIRDRKPAELGIGTATVVHIDTDVYEPALLALNFITPALPQGAMLLFDDFDQLAASNDKGERRAVKEWLKAHPGIELEAYRNYATFGRAFIVHRHDALP
jgi:hypothetical protein